MNNSANTAELPQGQAAANKLWAILKAPSIGFFVAIKLLILAALALNSVIVMDEFVQLGWAKYLGNGLFDTIWPV